MLTFTTADYLIIIIYIAIILYIGFFVASKKIKKNSQAQYDEDFLLAGRKLSLPLFVATLVATWYGNIFGIGEFVYSEGLVAWVCFGLAYYIAAILFAFFAADKIRNFNIKSIPEQIEAHYGKKAAWLASLIILIITLPAAYILMLGLIIQFFVGWNLWICIIFGMLISLTYLFSGGFRADVYTNAAQFILMYAGFIILFLFAINKFGNITDMLTKLPSVHKQLTGNYPFQSILAWFIIAFQTFVDPSFHQRCSAAKKPSIAKKGIFVSVLFWVLFDFLTLITGFYAKAYIPGINPIDAYPALAESVLPSIAKGLFVVSLLSVVMSTLDSYAFISAATIGNDIISPILKRRNPNSIPDTKKWTNVGLVITGIFAVLLAILLPSAVQLIYKTASVAIPGLLIPLIFTFSKRYYIPPEKAIIIMFSSSMLSLLWLIFGMVSSPNTIFSKIEPMIPGILLSLFLGKIFVKKFENYG